MEVRILHKFHDKADFTKVYLVGETVTFDDIRANHLISRGLAESTAPVEEPEEVIELVDEPAPVVEATETAEPEAEPVVKEQESEESESASKKRTTKKDN